MKITVFGREAFVYTGGKPFDPALPCVVFIHGACHDHTPFTLLARWFAHHGWSVLAVDLPGHMRSAGPLLPDVESMADWVLAAMNAAGVQRAAVVGHSMGSLIALHAAGAAPERVAHLVLLGTAFPMGVSDALLTAARDNPLQAMQMVNVWSISTTASKPGFPGPGNWLHGGALALNRRVQAAGGGANVFLHGFEVCHRYRGGLDAAANVRCPVTLVIGQFDQMTTPRAAKDIAAALKARVVTVASGHHLMAEQPDAVLNAVRTAISAPATPTR